MIHRLLAPHAERAYALLRIVAGVLFASHGAQKLLGLFGGTFPDDLQHQIGGVIELACGTLIAIGLFTRWAAFLASGTMAVAYVQFHWLRNHEFFPILNEGELALVYAFLFLYVACRGPGLASVDRARHRPSE